MSTVSLTLPSDGDTIDASDVNNPLNAIAAVINGGIDSTNVTAGGLTPANLVSGTGSSWAWQSWTPTYTNFTVGNSTVIVKYTQMGKQITCRFSIVVGTTAAGTIGSVIAISLPVTATDYVNHTPIGCIRLATGTHYVGYIRWASTTTADFIFYNAGGTYAIETGLPVNLASTNILSGSFVYEAA